VTGRVPLVTELIRRKRDGERLASAEISQLVAGFADGSIPDYQAAAWLMASYLRGLDPQETRDLTRALKDSGRSLDWRGLSAELATAPFADKHSTGGVGDKVSLILAPVAACLGIKVPMMSGRGLGHSGGTVDKLESIPGFTMYPDDAMILRGLVEVGVCMMAQREDLCPGDRKLYHLRDVTSTIESVPLITASIVSKKWAEGAENIVFDVKCGEAAFMNTPAKGRALATSLVETAKLCGLKATACLTRMDEPLGSRIGNASEVEESAWILRDDYPSEMHRRLAAPLVALTLDLAAEMAVLSGARPGFIVARTDAERALASGEAWRVFEHMLRVQGARDDWWETLPRAAHRIAVPAPRTGRLTHIHSRRLGILGILLGAGRRSMEDRIDPAVGIEMNVAVGDEVAKGESLLHLLVHDKSLSEEVRAFVDRDVPALFGFAGHDRKATEEGYSSVSDEGATLAPAFRDTLVMERIE
jgi:pyrimidine-nucleoside phosphorylase